LNAQDAPERVTLSTQGKKLRKISMKKYYCDDCSKQLSTKFNYDRHQQRLHGQKRAEIVPSETISASGVRKRRERMKKTAKVTITTLQKKLKYLDYLAEGGNFLCDETTLTPKQYDQFVRMGFHPGVERESERVKKDIEDLKVLL
jgi:uncharacterized protein YlaI